MSGSPDRPSSGEQPGSGSGAYTDVILRRWRRPRFRGDLPDATRTAEDVNPLCGDRVRLMLRTEGGRVVAARFLGDSCAICTAAADVLAEMVEGRSEEAARAVALEDVLAALAAEVRPARRQCIQLPLSVLATALAA